MKWDPPQEVCLRARDWLIVLTLGTRITNNSDATNYNFCFSDADDEIGMGGWCPQSQQYWYISPLPPQVARWKIAPLEFLVAFITLQMCSMHHTHSQLVMFIDNTNVCNNILKQRAKTRALDHIWQKFYLLAESTHTYVSLDYIPSKINFVADHISRGRPLNTIISAFHTGHILKYRYIPDIDAIAAPARERLKYRKALPASFQTRLFDQEEPFR